MLQELKSKVENSMVDGVWSRASEGLWKEYMAYCFSTRQHFGPKEENTLHYDKCQPTESLKLCLSDYVKLCTSRLGWGKVFILYGPYGSGKSQNLLTIAQGAFKGNPPRSILVNTGAGARDGNGYIEKLCSVLSYDGRSEVELAHQLVEVARNGAYTQVAREFTGCCDGVENIDEEGLIQIVPPIHGYQEKIDKMPVILLDSVKFLFAEGDKITNEHHIRFFLFIGALFEAAQGSGVAVFLAVSNGRVAEQLAVLNGGTKIVPATASIAKDEQEPNCWKQEATCDDGQKLTILWRKSLGWTEATMKIFLNREFKGTPQSSIEEAARKFGDTGCLRSAMEEIADEWPALANSATINTYVDDS